MYGKHIMKFLLFFVTFMLAHQVVLAKTLTKTTRQLIQSGEIFSLGLPSYSQVKDHLVFIKEGSSYGRNKTLEALEEIGSHPSLTEEAKTLVLNKFGNDRLVKLDSMLEFQRFTQMLDSLGLLEKVDKLAETVEVIGIHRVHEQFQREAVRRELRRRR